MKQQIDIQNMFLSQAQQIKVPLTIFLVNGFQLRGTLKGFDNFTVKIESQDNVQQVIYKQAISTIVPRFPINYNKLQ